MNAMNGMVIDISDDELDDVQGLMANAFGGDELMVDMAAVHINQTQATNDDSSIDISAGEGMDAALTSENDDTVVSSTVTQKASPQKKCVPDLLPALPPALPINDVEFCVKYFIANQHDHFPSGHEIYFVSMVENAFFML